MDSEKLRGVVMSRRSALKAGSATAFLLSQAALFETLGATPARAAGTAAAFSDIQFNMSAFVHPAATFNDGAGNVIAQFPVVYTLFQPLALNRTPTTSDQATLANALLIIEAEYPASPAGVLIFSVSYGVPYFSRLPSGLVAANMPGLASNPSRYVLQNAVTGPTDVVNGVVQGANNPPPKERFNVNVVLEQNDMLLQLRSDNLSNLSDVALWLQGSNSLNGSHVQSPDFNGLYTFQTPRIQFLQPGMPRKVADQAAAQNPSFYEFNTRINPDSSMVFGFVDQQVNSSAPNANTVTFVGDPNNVNTQGFTTAQPGDYFDNGSIVHFSHVIDDLYQFYQTAAQDPVAGTGEPFHERVQYMFRSNQTGGGTNYFGLPCQPNLSDEFTNGGGPAFVTNVFQGTGVAQLGAIAADGKATVQANADPNATFNGQQRLGHEVCLQRTSRASDGTPLHIRMDGPGFDGMDVPAFNTFPPGVGTSPGVDVPAGTSQFKLEFLIFVNSSDFFTQLRKSQASQDLFAEFGQGADPTGESGGVAFTDNGLERFLTATRRQNFLVPPRRHRAFPLLELT
jgi:hypothetical protein